MEATGFTGSEEIMIAEETICLKDALISRFACTVLSKIQIKKFNELAQVSALDDLLKIENKEALIEYMWGRELIDLFKEYPQGELSVEDFVGLLRPMPPRLYSIASSLKCPPMKKYI